MAEGVTKNQNPENGTSLQLNESHRREIIHQLKQMDEALDGQLLTKISTERGQDVVFFRVPWTLIPSTPRQNRVLAYGTHPELGPILITPGPLGYEVRSRTEKTHQSVYLTGNSWEELVKKADEVGPRKMDEENGQEVKSEVRTVHPEEINAWEDALDITVKNARAENAIRKVEEIQRLVLPEALGAVRRISEQLAADTLPSGVRRLVPPDSASDRPQ